MSTPNKVASRLLDAVWNEDVMKARLTLSEGADPNWIFNGYPILMHAVFTRNQEMVMMLIDNGATQVSQALGFALDRGIGELVLPLMMLGISPKMENHRSCFGPYPSRYAPLNLVQG